MKSLNRTLSLVLVLVMVFGLFGVASATSFTDTAKIQYTEAVDVMTGIGAINGYGDNTVQPAGTITREEAAKLITFSILGKNVAEKLTVGATGFKDVAANRWSAPYISFLVGKGIINGMGDGTFAPTANVTGYQLGKMMLVAAGFGAKGEFTGASWELAVAVTGNKYKVFSGAKATDYTKAATREEALLYAFNGIQIPQVEFNKVFDSYLGKGTGISGTTASSSIMKEVYSDLKQKEAYVDGVKGYVWTLNGKTISGFVDDVKVLATSKDGTAYDKLRNTSLSSFIGYYPNTAADGITEVVVLTVNGTKVDLTKSTDVTAAQALASKKGVIVKFIDTTSPSDGKYDVISFTDDKVANVTGDIIVRTTGAITKVTVPGLAMPETDVKNVVGYEGLKKGDVVLMHSYKDGGDYYVITKCGSFTGTLSSFSARNNSVTVDGKDYSMSGLTTETAEGLKNFAGQAGTTFYTDAAGYVVKADGASTAVSLENTLIVAGKATSTGLVANDAGDAFGSYRAKVFFGNGTSAVITIAKIGGKTAVKSDPAASTDVTVAAFNYYTYVKNDNGTYNLTIVGKQAMSNKVEKANPKIGAHLATSSTLFMYVDSSEKVTNFIGIGNAPRTTKAAVVSYVYDSKGYISLAVVVGGDPDTANDAKDYVFAVTNASETYDVNGNFYSYQAVVNGEIKPAVTSILSAEMSGLKLYAVTKYSSGRISEFTDVANVTDNKLGLMGESVARFAVNGTTVSYFKDVTKADPNDSAFIATDDCKVFVADAATGKLRNTDKPFTIADLAAISGTCEIYTVKNGVGVNGDGRIAQIFVVVK